MDAKDHKCILVDANFLIHAISDKSSPDDIARIENLFTTLQKSKAKLIIPMPALAEFLVEADVARTELVSELEKKSYIVLAPFDRASAFECALLDRAAKQSGDKRDGVDEPWQKIKIDRQIVSIGKVHGVTLVISGDKGVRSNASRVGMTAITIQELELPERAKQADMFEQTKAP